MHLTYPMGFSARRFLHIAFKRKNLIIKFMGFSLLFFIAGNFLKKSEYVAVAKVMMKPGRENLYSNPNMVNGRSESIFRFDAERQINSEIEILKSRALTEQVIHALGLEYFSPEVSTRTEGFMNRLPGFSGHRKSLAEEVLAFQKALKVRAVRDSEVILIQYSHENPEKASVVLKALMKNYMQRRLEIHSDDHAYEFFGKQSQLLENKISELEKNVETFKKINSFTSLEEERSLLLKEVSELRAGLGMTSIQEKETEEKVIQLKKQFAATPETTHLDRETGKNLQTIAALENKLSELQLQKSDLNARFTDKVPFKRQWIANMDQEIQMIQKDLKRAQSENLEGKVRFGANTLHHHLEKELLSNIVELKALQEKKIAQNNQLEIYLQDLDKFNRLEMEFNDLRQQLGTARSSLQSYRAKFEESRMSAAMDKDRISNVKVIESAETPLTPEKSHFFINLFITLVLGTLGGVGLAFFIEYLQDSLETIEDVESSLDLPILGSIASRGTLENGTNLL